MKKLLLPLIIIAFLVNSLGLIPGAYAQDFILPKPGVRVTLSPQFNPPILKGIKLYTNNPFLFDFVLDQGDSVKTLNGRGVIASVAKQSQQEQLKTESTRLIKYFLASLTVPEKDLWVNLSPYEKNRVIPQEFGLTEMGRDLLAEDYMLKQITASLIYPEDEIGKNFWKRVYEEAAKKFGSTNIPVNTFNKVWIVPQKAVVYENVETATAYIVESQLKVMLEEDYLSLEKNSLSLRGSKATEAIPTKTIKGEIASAPLAYRNDTATLGSQIIREIVIPALNKEINEGKNFARLRQVYHSLILATWYKKKIKNSILAKVYADKNKIKGIEYKDSVVAKKDLSLRAQRERQSQQEYNDIEHIYQRYIQAFKKGSYNLIKEEIDLVTQRSIPRKYFSGGANFDAAAMADVISFTHQIKLASTDIDHAQVIQMKLNTVDQAMSYQGRPFVNELRLLVEDFGSDNQLQKAMDRIQRLMESIPQYPDGYDFSQQKQEIQQIMSELVGASLFSHDLNNLSILLNAGFDHINRQMLDLAPVLLGLSQLSREELQQVALVDGWFDRVSQYQAWAVLGGAKPSALVDIKEEEIPKIEEKRDVFRKVGVGVKYKSFQELGYLPFEPQDRYLMMYYRYQYIRDLINQNLNVLRLEDAQLEINMTDEQIDQLMEKILINWQKTKLFAVLEGVLMGYGIENARSFARLNENEINEMPKLSVEHKIPGDEIWDAVSRFRYTEDNFVRSQELAFEMAAAANMVKALLNRSKSSKVERSVQIGYSPFNSKVGDSSRRRGAESAKDDAQLGGIDLKNVDKSFELQQDNRQEIKLDFDPAVLASLEKSEGFVPVIIHIQPLQNLPEFLGVI